MRQPPLELRSIGVRRTHEHLVDPVFMGGRDKPGHDE
jgi:hypothetical protein